MKHSLPPSLPSSSSFHFLIFLSSYQHIPFLSPWFPNTGHTPTRGALFFRGRSGYGKRVLPRAQCSGLQPCSSQVKAITKGHFKILLIHKPRPSHDHTHYSKLVTFVEDRRSWAEWRFHNCRFPGVFLINHN